MSVAVMNRQDGAMTTLRRPRVWIDGVLRSDIAVIRLTMTGPADRREAELRLDRVAGGATVAEQAAHAALIGRRVLIADAIDMSCGEAIGLPLLVGRIVERAGATDAKRDVITLRAVDDWSAQLARPVALNAAATVGEAIAALQDEVGASRVQATVAPATRRERFGRSTAAATVEQLIERLNRDHGIVARRRLTDRDGSIELRETRNGRAVVIGHGPGPAGQAITSRQLRRPLAMPLKLVGRMAGEIVERTIELTADWAAADEAGADGDYSPATSTDWPRFANVYRRWTAAAHPGPLGDCLTTDAAGHRLLTITDYSADGGETWRTLGGGVERLPDVAGVRLTDALLPAEFFAAARAGAVRVRVTATTRSAEPIEIVRWVGNPFAGPFVTRVIQAGDDLSVRRVGPSSRFAAAVASGQRNAAVRDDRPTLERMLVDAGRLAAPPAGATGRFVVSRPLVGLSVGDRLIDASADPAQPWSRRAGRVITRIEHRWGEPPATTITIDGGADR